MSRITKCSFNNNIFVSLYFKAFRLIPTSTKQLFYNSLITLSGASVVGDLPIRETSSNNNIFSFHYSWAPMVCLLLYIPYEG